MYRRLLKLRSSGSSYLSYFSSAQLRRKASNSLSAIQDTFYATKDIFETHKVVFTVSTSIASVATAWIGYSLRHYHDTRVDRRLESIENAMKNKHQIDDHEFKKLASGAVSIPACVATAGTTLILGYGLGWRGGKWYADRKFKREQMKLLGQIKPGRWPLRLLKPPLKLSNTLKLLRRPLIKARSPEKSVKASEETLQHSGPIVKKSGETHPSC